VIFIIQVICYLHVKLLKSARQIQACLLVAWETQVVVEGQGPSLVAGT
jgi:hypothetical protein